MKPGHAPPSPEPVEPEPPRSCVRPIPRLASVVDDDVDPTGVSELMGELARLANPSCVAQLTRPLSREDVLSPPEAFVAMLVESNMSVDAIFDMSPLREDETLRFLAGLVEKGIVRLVQRASTPPRR